MAKFHQLTGRYGDTSLEGDDLENDEQYVPSHKGTFRKCWDGLRASFGNMLMVLLIILLALNLQATANQNGLGWPWTSSDRIVYKSFEKDERYMSLDHKYDVLWKPMMSADAGIVHIDNGREAYNGSIGMFHALHCLVSFRHALQRAKAGENIGVDQHNDAHWPHCFDYVRQALICAADNTIERAHFRNGTIAPDASHNHAFIEGRLDVRRCRDSEKLFELQRLHRAWPEDSYLE